MGDHNKCDDRDKNDQPSQECVEKSVQIGKNDDKCRALGSDEKLFVRTKSIDMCNIIAKKKPGILIRQKPLAAGAA